MSDEQAPLTPKPTVEALPVVEVTSSITGPMETEKEHIIIKPDATIEKVPETAEAAPAAEPAAPVEATFESPARKHKKKSKGKEKIDAEQDVSALGSASPRSETSSQPDSARGSPRPKLVSWLEETKLTDSATVSPAWAALGETTSLLKGKEARVPAGFCTTSAAYKLFLSANPGLEDNLRACFQGITSEESDIRKQCKKARNYILAAAMPSTLMDAAVEAYGVLCRRAMPPEESAEKVDIDCIARAALISPSDDPAHFMGPLESYANISGNKSVIETIQRCFALAVSPTAVRSFQRQGVAVMDGSISACFQKLVRADTGSSGVIIPAEVESGNPSIVTIRSNWGVGDTVSTGASQVDEFQLFKPLLSSGKPAILSKSRGRKKQKSIYHRDGTKLVAVPKPDRYTLSLTDDQLVLLGNMGCIIESTFKEPMVVEFAIDGAEKACYIVHVAPDHLYSTSPSVSIDHYSLGDTNAAPLLVGAAVGHSIANGRVHVVTSPHKSVFDFKPGDILVGDYFDAEADPIVRKAGGVILNRGDRRSYIALLARSLGIPAIVGASKATDTFKTGQEITIDCSHFPMGRVYDGTITFNKTSSKVEDIPVTETRVMGVVKPGQAFFQNSPAAVGGVIFLDSIVRNLGVHPLSFSKYDEIKDRMERKYVDELTVGYPAASLSEYYVDAVTSTIAQTCAAFHPRNVIVQLADMTSSDLRNLSGGSSFESPEVNPAYGLRGLSRASHDDYKDAFGSECTAIKRVLDMGFTNLIVCVPFIRSVAEVDSFREALHSFGLETSAEPELGTKVRLYLDVQVPSNIFFAPKLSKQFAGFIVDVKKLTSSLFCQDMDDAAYKSFLHTHAENLEPALAQIVRAARGSNIPVGLHIHSDEHAAISPWITTHRIDFLAVDAARVVDTINIIAGRERSESLSSLSKSGHVSSVSESSTGTSESEEATLGEAVENVVHLKAE
eukprot:TRINITY_DN8622_c0_g1_i1.p1 TRINITY_DN8622_c0_g1~~TRINITY_DN8622_c0_g1_i1.p1  ORF type:complete len:957 (+),score=196.34 TRINITY_DN8622_c0_g1_i1:164-3034(+)